MASHDSALAEATIGQVVIGSRPRVDQPHYGDHLDDPRYWRPYVSEALSRHTLPVRRLEPPFAGTFPTFLVGDLVVKLFGETFDGAASCAAERSMHRLLAGHPEIPAPRLVAEGHLFNTAPRWPYLVTERLTGTALRDAALSASDSAAVARRLGEVVARLHRLRAPEPIRLRNLVPRLRATAAERLARFGLPTHLVDQVPAYLLDAPAPDTLVHADITADHVFTGGGRLVGIIDWGDAIVADSYYELVAISLDALGGRQELIEGFLDGYGWQRTDEFGRRTLQAMLEFQFDAVSRLGQIIDLDTTRSLADLAARLCERYWP